MAEAVGRRVPSQTHGSSCPASSTVGTPWPWRWPWLYQRIPPQSLWGIRSLLHPPRNGCRGQSHEEGTVHSPGSTHLSGAP